MLVLARRKGEGLTEPLCLHRRDIEDDLAAEPKVSASRPASPV